MLARILCARADLPHIMPAKPHPLANRRAPTRVCLNVNCTPLFLQPYHQVNHQASVCILTWTTSVDARAQIPDCVDCMAMSSNSGDAPISRCCVGQVDQLLFWGIACSGSVDVSLACYFLDCGDVPRSWHS